MERLRKSTLKRFAPYRDRTVFRQIYIRAQAVILITDVCRSVTLECRRFDHCQFASLLVVRKHLQLIPMPSEQWTNSTLRPRLKRQSRNDLLKDFVVTTLSAEIGTNTLCLPHLRCELTAKLRSIVKWLIAEACASATHQRSGKSGSPRTWSATAQPP